ncbi:hypothetical protein ES705_43405 [subsurface metagenome]
MRIIDQVMFPSHLWEIDLETKEERRLTGGGMSIRFHILLFRTMEQKSLLLGNQQKDSLQNTMITMFTFLTLILTLFQELQIIR